MYSASHTTHNRSQSSRSPVNGQSAPSQSQPQQQQQQQQQQYTAPAAYAQPQILHPHPPALAGPAVLPGSQQAAAPGAFAPPNTAAFSHAPELLHPSTQRARSSSPGQSHPESQDLRRSQSLNENMSNSQPVYYQMAAAAPMSGYPQNQLYGPGAMPQSSYYQAPPQSPVPLNSGYIDQPRQGMQPMGYDYSMQYSQSSYPATYATSYAGNNSVVAPAYGSPVASQQYPRPGQPAQLAGAPVQVVDRAKKPQCWEHGCNGREFSTFSNLLRHQREKSGTAAKSYCPHCGAEFTRTTARNGHMEHGKCKTRRAATGSSS